jgi:hypothetical protein
MQVEAREAARRATITHESIERARYGNLSPGPPELPPPKA